MNQRGVSLMELLVVMALLSLIVGIAVPLTLEYVRGVRAESQIQSMYANFTEARQRAIQHSQLYLLELSSSKFNVYEDQNLDGLPQPGEKIKNLSLDQLQYPLEGNIGGTPIGGSPLIVRISRRGLLEPIGLVHIEEKGRRNCIDIDYTRIGLGKYDGTVCKVY